MLFYKTKKFLALQKKWYDAIRTSGFTDAETNGWLNSYHSIKSSGERTYRKKISQKWESRRGLISHSTRTYQGSVREYYRMAAQYLESHQFFCEINERIWRMHAQGLSQVTIGKRVKERTHKQCRFIIECLRDDMLGKLTKKQKKLRKKFL